MLKSLVLTQSLDKREYKEQLLPLQVRLRHLAEQLYRQRRSLVLVFEGWDGAGKGGAIRRLTQKLDPRGYLVYPIAAPTGDDATRHYLWRFWRRLVPARDKQILIFDRSWYGRVLVERVEGFASEEEWRRAYDEIQQLEGQLADQHILLAKIWFHIDREEQLRRFEARKAVPHKRWKLTEEDWRNREKWDLYESAVEDMLLRTSTPTAPWTIVEGNDKYFARIKTLRLVVDLLTSQLDEEGND